MTHPLVTQVRFARSEFRRGLKGVTAEEGQHHFGPMNCISWIVGHMAWQEQRYWLTRAQGQVLLPELDKLTASGAPQSTPPLDEMWTAWNTIVEAVNPYLESLTTETLTTYMIVRGKQHSESVGSMLRRVAYHYWYHNGEAQAIRQMLGHTKLSQFVGSIHEEAPYVPE
jgi:hypothetical protein